VVPSAAPSTTPTRSPTKGSSSKKNNSLSDGAIAGIVIGSVAFVGILVGLGYYFFIYSAQGSSSLAYNPASSGELQLSENA